MTIFSSYLIKPSSHSSECTYQSIRTTPRLSDGEWNRTRSYVLLLPLGLVGEEERVLSIGILGNFGRHVLTSTSDLFQTEADVGFPNFILFVGPRNKGKGSKFSPADTRSPSHNFRHKVLRQTIIKSLVHSANKYCLRSWSLVPLLVYMCVYYNRQRRIRLTVAKSFPWRSISFLQNDWE